MTFQPEESGYPQVCPHLGLADDADSHATYSTEAHRCYNLPNPTKIALPHQETYCLVANHVTCPVYQGQGIPTGRPGAAAAAGATAGTAASTDPFASGRRASEPGVLEPTAPIPEGGAGGRPPRRRPPGATNPRPRGGGVSMPVATIALFALAIGVIALAFVVTQLAGGNGGDNNVSPADRLRTQEAQRTSTPATETTPDDEDETPAAPTTPAGAEATNEPVPTETPEVEPTEEPAGEDEIYVVQPGDICATIADSLGVSLQDLLDANGMTEADCTSLEIGQELIVPR